MRGCPAGRSCDGHCSPDGHRSPTPSWRHLLDPRRPEILLAFCSLWCSAQLWLWPRQFTSANSLFLTQVGLAGHAGEWALVGAVAAMLKLGSLAAQLYIGTRWWCTAMLLAGLFMSTVFWMIVGIATTVAAPHSLVPVVFSALALAVAWQLAGWRRKSRRQP